MLFTLLIICIIIFILYHFYVDYRNWSNVGGDFAEGMSNKTCNTEAECKKDAESLGLQIGGRGYPFAGNWSNKGLYAYSKGSYAGIAYYGTGGTEAEMKGELKYKGNGAYRPSMPSEPTKESEKITGKGADYRGFQNKTKGGLTCQSWNSDATHKRHSAIKTAYTNKKNGTGDHNYCRNPTGNHSTIWCYTTDPSKRWDNCEPLKVEDKIEQEDDDDSNQKEDNSFILIDDNFKKPIRNSVIDLKNFKMGKDYNLEFIIKPLGKKWGWTNILHNTFTGKNCCRVGDRYPAIWFWSNTTRLHISCGAKNSWNWNTTQNPNYNLPINRETTVNIRLQNNIFTVILTDYNGNVVYRRNQAVNKTKPPKYIVEEKSRFYFSDPWYRPANVKVKNMILINLDPQPVDETAEILKALQNNSLNTSEDDVSKSNNLTKQLLDSLLKNSNTQNIPLNQKLQLIQSLQQQRQLPRQVIQILQPPRQITNEQMSNMSVSGTMEALNSGDQMVQQLPSNVSLQPQSIPRISNFTLFNEDIMKKVLSNKNLIPNDVKVGIENKENFIRIGKNFMIEISKIRNLALPNIEEDDYEKIGRITSKIYIKNNNNDSPNSIKVSENSLISTVRNILNGGDETREQTTQYATRNPNQTTGMFSNNGNRYLSTENTEDDNKKQEKNNTGISGKTNKSGRLSKQDLNGSLCMWQGCQIGNGQPYDSVYSIF